MTRTTLTRRLAVLAGAAVALTAAVAPPDAGAATSCTKYAAPTGSDSNSGTLSSPYKSPQALVNSLTAGQTGCLKGGTYSMSSLRFTRAGASGSPITLTSAPGERAKLVGGYIYVTNAASWVTISDLTIDATDAAENAVQIMSANVVFERNDLTNRARPVTFGRLKGCMHLGWNGGSATAVNPIIRQNKFHDCGDPANGNKDHAIYYERVQGGQTVDNVFWNTAAFAIHLYPNANGHRVAHNVIDGSGQSGAIFASQNSFVSSNNVFEQNVVTGSRYYNVTSYWGGGTGSGNVARNNCWTAGGSGMTGGSGYATSGNITADPQYVDKATRDYRLKSGSGCMAVVGYDTAAKVAAGGSTQPTEPAPTTPTDPTPTDPTPTDPAPTEPTPTQPAPDDDTAPSLSWTNPVAGGSVTGQLDESSNNCRAAASDASGIERVDFYLDGKLLNTERSAPWSCIWNTATATKAKHSLTAVAWDTVGNATSRSIRVTVR